MLIRSILRSISGTFGKYLAILSIIALGVGFFTGLRISTDSMLKTADIYLTDNRLFDFRLISTLGFTKEDVESFSLAKSDYTAVGSVTADFLSRTGENTDLVFRAHMITEGTNGLDVISGRMPVSGNECLFDAKYFGPNVIGTNVSLSPDNTEETSDIFRFDAYTVVGIANSSYYVNFERGNTSLGSGNLSGFVYISPEGFNCDYYTEIFICLGDRGDIFTDEYEAAVDESREELEILLDERAEQRYLSLRSDAIDAIADARKELDDGRAEYSSEKSEAEAELSDALSALNTAREELDSGWQELSDGKTELESRKEDAESSLDDARYQLDSGWMQLSSGEEELDEKERQAEAELTSARENLEETSRQLEKSQEELDSLKTLYSSGSALTQAVNAQTGSPSFSSPASLASAVAAGTNPDLNSLVSAVLSDSGMTAESFAATWTSAEQQLGAPLDETSLSVMEEKMDAARHEYEAGSARLEKTSSETRAALDDARALLEEKRAELREAEMEYSSFRDSAYEEIAKAEAELSEAEQKLNDGEKEYADGMSEYNEARAEADAKFADAEEELDNAAEKIKDAEKELEELEEPSTFVLDRCSNIGYASLENDMGIVRGVSKVFPLFFFLVAALVCVTTMTRMIDEQRTQDGVLKALGYPDRAIVGQYLFYSGSASVIGCIIGFLLGSKFMPMALWKVYGIMYSIDRPVVYLLDWKLFALSVAGYLLCSMGATYLVCRKELSESAAELIRPKSPPAGTRIMLERVTFIWKRVKFLHKVSIRNIIRYKKRMIMMILGVGGCTALLLTGFGIRDSIQHIVDYQYDEIEIFDCSVTFIKELDEDDIQSFMYKNQDIIKDISFLSVSSMDITAGGKTVSVNAVAFRDSMEDFVDLHSGNKNIDWPKTGETVLDYRLAAECGIGTGDTITLVDSSYRTLTLTVTGIFDNYIYDYAFISTDTYLNQWGELPGVKTAYINVSDGVDVHSASARMMKDNRTADVNVLNDMRQRVSNMLKSMNYIVLIVIVCAGALAFIVLYNLTNISINERRREIATLKVLGFYPRESSAYVFRENLVLTAISALFGLPMGYALLHYVMSQIKISSFYFGCRAAPLSYVIAVALTFVFALAVDGLLYFKLEGVSMADSMKAVE